MSSLEWCADRARELADNVERVVYGKREVVETAVTCLIAGGHLLIDDVPGIGKTAIARCLSGSIDGSWTRLQFTPDLLPSDVTGTTVYDQRTGDFEFVPGPVFAHIVLADEINRASPKTQSALLEVMEERQVSVDGTPQTVPRPFMVIATQNPIDMEGTYRLPEAQLDRFLMRITVGYPSPQDEAAILESGGFDASYRQLASVVAIDDVRAMIAAAREAHVSAGLRDYIVALCGATRDNDLVRLGVSPRGTLALQQAAQARAVTRGRDHVLPEDIKVLAASVLAHRIIVEPSAGFGPEAAASVIDDILAKLPVPHAIRA